MGSYARVSLDGGETTYKIVDSSEELQEVLKEIKKRPCGFKGLCIQWGCFKKGNHRIDYSKYDESDVVTLYAPWSE